MLRRFALAALAVSAGLAAAADGLVPDYVPPATNTLVGIHLRALIDSGLVQSIAGDLLKSANAKWTTTSPFPGGDPLKDVDEIVVATTVEGDRTPSLIICRGRFPVDEIGQGVERYRGIPLRHGPDGNTIAVLDAGTVLGGELNEVRAAIDRRQAHTAGLNPELARRAGELSARYAIWGVGNLSHGYHPPNGSLGGFGSLDHFDFGIALGPGLQGLQLAATLHVRAPEDAEKLAVLLQAFQMMAKAQPDNNGAKLETHVENGTLSLSLSLTGEAMKKAIAQEREAFARGLSQAAAGQLIPNQAKPASKETKIVTDDHGNSVQVTLPGRH